MGDQPDDRDADGESELGRQVGTDVSEMRSILGHAYRGELDRETTWRSRLDQTITWAVTVMAAILTWAFSSVDNPHYLILVAILVVVLFLLVEARRYRDYDVYRSRVRLFQREFLADALDPERADDDADWRRELGADFRRPTMKISMLEAVSNRLRRVYLALLVVLLIAWIVRITAFTPTAAWVGAAAVGVVPGEGVALVIGAFYAVVLVLAMWPRDREAMGEFREGERGEWKQSE